MLYRRMKKKGGQGGEERLAQEAEKDQGFGSQRMSEHRTAEKLGFLKPGSSGFSAYLF